MKFKSLFLIISLVFFFQSIFGQNDSLGVSKKRVLIVSSSLIGALGVLIGIYKTHGGLINRFHFILMMALI